MEGKAHFSVPHMNTDSSEFEPATKLPADLAHFSEMSEEMRKSMTPELKRMLRLTDMMALRSAALPPSEE